MHPFPRVTRGIRGSAAAPGLGRSLSRHTRAATAFLVLSSVLVAASCDDSPTDPVDEFSIETAALAEAIEGVAYEQQLAAVGGSGGYSWLLAAGSLPAGLTLSPAGAISGTPAAAGTSGFRVQVTDSRGRTATADLSIAVVQTLAVHTTVLPDGVVGETYSVQLQAVGGRGTRAWSIPGGAGGAAASWLTVSAGGMLTGNPAVSGASTVTVAVADESGQQATRQLALPVLDPVAVAAIHLPAAIQGRAYAAQLVATGGDGVYTWDLESGTLPAGMALGSGGALTGTPVDAGEFTFTARAADRASRAGTRALTLTVERAPIIQTTSLPPGEPGEPYAAQLVATGGTGTYAWSVTEGDLPAGLTLSATGTLSGTPTTAGSATFTVQVTDKASASDSRPFTLVVAEIAELGSGEPVAGLGGDAGSVRYYGIEVPAGAARLTVAISGGTGDVDLYIRQGTLPALHAYDCRPLRAGNDETCSVPSSAAGHWYIMLRGHADYGGVTLVATIEE